MRVFAYIDGYNVYHALKKFRQDYLKWLNLWALCDRFVPNKSASLQAVHYFSAYANWLPAQKKRHQAYVKMLGICDYKSKIQRKHVEQCLLPESIIGSNGHTIVRPKEYDPPDV